MKVICYDTAGNVLVEHKTSLAGTGYPVDVALSANGEVMQVVYLYTQNGQMVSRLYYYNFGKAGKDEADHKVSGKNYKNTILASGFSWMQIHPWQSVMTVWPSIAEKKFRNSP